MDRDEVSLHVTPPSTFRPARGTRGRRRSNIY
jgi:hypothetical protein